MHFSAFFSPSLLILFALDACRPTAAATLAVSPVKRGGWTLDAIQCAGPLPVMPADFPRFPSLLHLCAGRLQHARNLACRCRGPDLACGFSSRVIVRAMIAHCYNHCNCGTPTKKLRDHYTWELKYGAAETIPEHPDASQHEDTAPDPIRPPSGNSNGAGVSNTQTCSYAQTCTSVSHGCGAPKKACKCYAAMETKTYYRSGYCGLSKAIGHKRDLAQQRRSYYLNATARFASTAPSGPPPDLADQLASGLLPSPCNASYVSFACADSIDGIVHESPQNWLGALVPENAKELPPVPEEFLRIHGVGGGGTSQVVVE